MKNCLIALFLLISVCLPAQDEKPISKGNFAVGGGGSFGYGSDFSESSSGNISISIYPSLGYFFADGFMAGVSPSFSFSSTFGNITVTNNTASIGLDVFLKKYFKIGIFIGGSVGYGFLRHHYESIGYSHDNRSHTLDFVPAVGYAFFLGPNVSLEIALRDGLSLNFEPDQAMSFNMDTYVSAGFFIFL